MRSIGVCDMPNIPLSGFPSSIGSRATWHAVATSKRTNAGTSSRRMSWSCRIGECHLTCPHERQHFRHSSFKFRQVKRTRAVCDALCRHFAPHEILIECTDWQVTAGGEFQESVILAKTAYIRIDERLFNDREQRLAEFLDRLTAPVKVGFVSTACNVFLHVPNSFVKHRVVANTMRHQIGHTENKLFRIQMYALFKALQNLPCACERKIRGCMRSKKN